MPDHQRYDAIILAGGTGKRLGGPNKPALTVGGISLLNRVLDACSSARSVVVVGNARRTARPVRWTLEHPPHGGPLAAIAAGLTALPRDSELVVTLAADLPYLTTTDVGQLVAAVADHDAAVFNDDSGTTQPLAAAYRRVPLTRRLLEIGELRHQPARLALEDLHIARIPDRGATRDCDTGPARRRTSGPGVSSATMSGNDGATTLDDWTKALATKLGVTPGEVDIMAILDLARLAAHNVARPAAPVTTFIAGYTAGLRGGGHAEVETALRTAAALACADLADSHNQATNMVPQ